MRVDWLRKTEGADEVIVIFGGWAVGPQIWLTLQSAADLLFVSDYRNLDAALPELGGYAARSLIAWSFGVATYALWQAGRVDPFQCKVALCGGMTPVNRLTGIAPQRLQVTANSLSQASFAVFQTRCFGTEQPEQPIDLAACRAELLAIAARDYPVQVVWDRVWIARQDQIFSLTNMQWAWAGCAAVRRIDAPHAPFAQWSRLQDVLA